MTIYNINRGIGWASSGVEYAQAYRAKIFRALGQEAKFIFTDMFQSENIIHFTQNIGLKDHEVVWLYSFFTDITLQATTYTVEEFETGLSLGMQKTSQTREVVRYEDSSKELVVVGFLRKNHPNYVQRVEYLSKGSLIRKDYYSYTRLFSEYYAPHDQQPKLYKRTFFNEDGSVAYEENCDGTHSLYRFKDGFFCSKEELLARMLDQLQLTSQDILLMDRATGTGQAVLRHKGEAKVAVVIHAEHYNAHAVTEDTILWNNYYEYQFTHADKIDAFITSTQAQKDTLAGQLAHYQHCQPAIFVLPVGSLDQLSYPIGDRRPFSLVTCSRLAMEKHIDWLIEGVVLAQKELPQLTFAIYGAGGEESKLSALIAERQATDFIYLKGHHDLSEVYKNYQVYLTASTSEGFGLTLMEAVGSGLPIIGLDVPYGNQTFVDDGKNGKLLPRKEPDDGLAYAYQFAQEIVSLYRSGQLLDWQEASYQRAEAFLTSRLEASWHHFIQEVTR